MADDEQMSLGELVKAFVDDPAYASGERAVPRAVSPEEALQVLDGIFSGCNASDEHVPGLAKSAGHEIACERACASYCCEELVLVSMTEALAVAAAIAKLDDEVRERCVARLKSWVEKWGHRAQAGADALEAAQQDNFDRISRGHALERQMCPLRDPSGCVVYESRPLSCRKVWVADTAEHCRATTKRDAPRALLLTHPNLDSLYERAELATRGVQAALGLGTKLYPLPVAVLGALDAPVPESA